MVGVHGDLLPRRLMVRARDPEGCEVESQDRMSPEVRTLILILYAVEVQRQGNNSAWTPDLHLCI